jgi:hypothetical protein
MAAEDFVFSGLLVPQWGALVEGNPPISSGLTSLGYFFLFLTRRSAPKQRDRAA